MGGGLKMICKSAVSMCIFATSDIALFKLETNMKTLLTEI